MNNMNMPNMPGFAATASLYEARGHYRAMTCISNTLTARSVSLALPKYTGRAAACQTACDDMLHACQAVYGYDFCVSFYVGCHSGCKYPFENSFRPE